MAINGFSGTYKFSLIYLVSLDLKKIKMGLLREYKVKFCGCEMLRQTGQICKDGHTGGTGKALCFLTG